MSRGNSLELAGVDTSAKWPVRFCSSLCPLCSACLRVGCRQALRLTPHQALLLPLPVFVFLGLTFIVLLLAFGQPDLQLDAASRVMQVERNEGIAGTFDLADQLADFLGVKQQLASARGVRLDVG